MMAKASSSAGVVAQDSALLLHPELLSRDFLLLSLERRNIPVEDAFNDKEKLTKIFVQHAMPLPQRDLPRNRWGRMMESKRGEKKITTVQKSAGTEGVRKRPPIVFDGCSTSTSIKVKRTENGDALQRLNPSPKESTNSTQNSSPALQLGFTTPNKEAKGASAANHGQHDSSPVTDTTLISPKSAKLQQPIIVSAVKLKRTAPKDESDVANDAKPTEAKKKIQHVTWP
ncbi:hypothetical protein XENTR_v10006301 [Xenopus tropicalis]|uniref:Ashwin n=1 Tax=Xenopus tropicalis TaxID=8364 RepID=F7BDK7_XENTR|nr:ashwin [Xenopus tropicalis]KAE8625520.1 hypothetical protein XENTR_v10006301 [Xenopus tropicalis]